MRKLMLRFAKAQDGVTLLEYGLIAGLVAVVAAGTLGSVGSNVNTALNTVATAFSGKSGSAGP